MAMRLCSTTVVRKERRYPLLIVGLLGSLIACSDGSGSKASGGSDVTASTVAPEEANVFLIVSSQSYDKDKVGIRLRLDDAPLAHGAFITGSGHNHVSLPLLTPPGRRRFTAVADDGTTGNYEMDVAGQRRWVTLSYWSGGEEGPHFRWRQHDSRPRFA